MGPRCGAALLLLACGARADAAPGCPGAVNVSGFGWASVVPTGWGAPGVAPVRVLGGAVVPQLGSRAYLAEQCTGAYNHSQYLGLNLLGKTLRYTTDLSGLGCGCNAALYLTSMRQNEQPSECSDYYCDANNVCGESCAEIDVQEANQRAWHSTLHSQADHSGLGRGIGGGGAGWSGPRDWTTAQYGPGAQCIDTGRPFEVAVSFPASGACELEAMTVTLSQAGSACPLSVSIGGYAGSGELSAALRAGMTPIVSYWSSPDMLWMDGQGQDFQGPCAADEPEKCGAAAKFYGFSVEALEGSPCRAELTEQRPARPPLARPEPPAPGNATSGAPRTTEGPAGGRPAQRALLVAAALAAGAGLALAAGLLLSAWRRPGRGPAEAAAGGGAPESRSARMLAGPGSLQHAWPSAQGLLALARAERPEAQPRRTEPQEEAQPQALEEGRLPAQA